MANPTPTISLSDLLGNNTPVTRQGPDGNIYQLDPKTGTWVPAPGMPTATSENKTPYRFKDEQGNIWEYTPLPPGVQGPNAPKMIYQAPSAPIKTSAWTDPTTGAQWIINSETGEKIKQLSSDIPGYQPSGVPRAPQLAPRYPEQIQQAQLQNQGTQLGMFGDLPGASQQHAINLETLKGMIARGEIQPDQGDRLAALSRQNLAAGIQGTTPWDYQTNREGIAKNVMTQNQQYGTSLAQALMSGASGIYDKILSSQNPPLNFNPLLMAKSFVQDVGAGPQMTDLARAVLMGALGGQ